MCLCENSLSVILELLFLKYSPFPSPHCSALNHRIAVAIDIKSFDWEQLSEDNAAHTPGQMLEVANGERVLPLSP